MAALVKSGNNKRMGADNERVTSLFQPDVLLPEEYLDTYRRKSHVEPEKRLMLAILEDAVGCYQKHIDARKPREKTMFQESEEWIFETDSSWLFSFESICEYLGIEPEYFRKRLLKWKQGRESHKAKVFHLNPGRQSSWGDRKTRQAPGFKDRVIKNGTE